jgi:pimeloyl-ACP methyl ester carboxylesterase
LALVFVVGACATDSPSTPSTAATDATAVTPTSTAAVTTTSGDAAGEPQLYAVAGDGRQLMLLCEGTGSPTVVFEDGHPSETGGIARFRDSEIWAPIAEQTRVCAYDRAGWGSSDPAPNEPRDADDVIDDLGALLTAAGEEGPYVLVGSSFGGMIVTYYAARHPGEVGGVVLLDVPAPSATLSTEEIPETAWDHPTNPEHVDIIPEFETRFALEPEPMEAPLTVITATAGQSNVEDQAFWLELSPQATQVELQGGHDIDQSDPDGVVAEILEMVDAAR